MGGTGSATEDNSHERNDQGSSVDGIGGISGTPHDGVVADKMHKLDKRVNVAMDKKHMAKDMPLSTMKEAAAKGIRGLYRAAVQSGDQKAIARMKAKFGPQIAGEPTSTLAKPSIRQKASMTPVKKPTLRRHRGIKLGQEIEKQAIFKKLVSKMIPKLNKRKSAPELIKELKKKRAEGITHPKLNPERN